MRQHDPRRQEHDRQAGQHPRRHRRERPPSKRGREQRARHHAGDRGADVRHRQELRAVGLEEDRAGGDHDPRRREAEGERLSGQQEDPLARRLVRAFGSRSRPGRLDSVVGGGLQLPRQASRSRRARSPDGRRAAPRTVRGGAAAAGSARSPSRRRIVVRARGRRTRRRRRPGRSRPGSVRRCGRGPCPSATTKSQSSTVPRSMIVAPASNGTSSRSRATATSVWPGTSPNNATSLEHRDPLDRQRARSMRSALQAPFGNGAGTPSSIHVGTVATS